MADTFYNAVDLPEVASVSAPASGQQRVYGKPDGNLYSTNSAGVEFNLSASGAAEVYIGTLPSITNAAVGFESATIDGQSVYIMKVNN